MAYDRPPTELKLTTGGFQPVSALYGTMRTSNSGSMTCTELHVLILPSKDSDLAARGLALFSDEIQPKPRALFMRHLRREFASSTPPTSMAKAKASASWARRSGAGASASPS